MRHYEKIETLFERATDGTKELIPYKWRNETVKYLAYNEWLFTEKADGTNIVVGWDGHDVTFGGRTERANIPAPLFNRLNKLFGGETNAQLFEQHFGDKEVYFYGEGYGNKIQAVGSRYIPDGVDFVLFDVWINGSYLPRGSVEEIAREFGCKVIPVVGAGTLDDAISFVASHPMSELGDVEMEGVVCRPSTELCDRNGNRIIVKVKYRDFKNWNNSMEDVLIHAGKDE